MKCNKKQAILAVLMIALLLLGAVGGTMAYLMAQDGPIVNEFKPAEVPSEVEESLNGSTKSNVVIRNNGNVSAYIRAAIVVTWKDDSGNIYHQNPVEEDDYIIYINTADWTKQGTYYYHNAKVPAGDVTKVLINSCTPVAAKAPAGYFLNVEIIGQAIQAEGITGKTGPLDAWTKATATGSAAN